MPADNATRYEARLLSALARHSPKWRGVDIQAAARANALAPIGAEIRADATRVCDDVTQGSFRNPGALRRVERVDAGGQRTIEWHGPNAFVEMFMPPVATTKVAFGDGRGRWFNTAGEIC